ncbi:MAG: TetR/AcrR family transcriptional regulator, partial [Rubricoccaceae bacterium]|nr:TetR/AcrR family transcriptional regulator [Rubricoccaceae bacterium]
QEMVDNILSIAREMMQADGVAALNFNAIARRLGMTPPALYTYFDSKHAIYDALFRMGFEEFDRRMQSGLLEKASPFEQVKAAFEGHLAFAQENPDLYQLMMQRPVPGFVPSEESMAVSLAVLQKSSEWLQQIVEEAETSPDMPIQETRDLLFAMMQGLANLHLANDPELPVGQGRFGKLAAQAAGLFFGSGPSDTI